VPIELPGVEPDDELVVTSPVVAVPPEPLATFLAERSCLRCDVPHIKRILALLRHSVCQSKLLTSVYGMQTGRCTGAPRMRAPSLPWLLPGRRNWEDPASLDRRSFHPIRDLRWSAERKPPWTFEDE
jgi:type IV secretory pathway protease TraF